MPTKIRQKNCFAEALYWYQKKISSYDQQHWEKKVEERMLKGIHLDVAKKVAKLKPELIDLDLIRGSAFTKAKPKQSWLTTTYFGIIRVIFFPWHLCWWADQSNHAIALLLFLLYCLQLAAMFVYLNCDRLNQDKFQTIPLSEVFSPFVMFFILGSIHSQISASSLISSKAKGYSKVAAAAAVVAANQTNFNLISDHKNENKHKMNARKIANTRKKSAKEPDTRKSCVKTSECKKRKRSYSHGLTSLRKLDSNELLTITLEQQIASCDEGSPYSTINSNINNNVSRTRTDQSDQSDTWPLDSKQSSNASLNDQVNFRKNKLEQTTCDEHFKLMKNQGTNCELNLSSSESDRGMPPSPIKVLNDWPMINSDNSSDEDDDDDEEEMMTRDETELNKENQSGSANTNALPVDINSNYKEDSFLPNIAKTDQNDNISCSIHRNNEWRKVDLSVLDISSFVIKKVEGHTHSNEYFYFGICCSLLLAIMPQIFRLQQTCPSLQIYSPITIKNMWNESQSTGAFNYTQNAPMCGSISASNSTSELIEFLRHLPVMSMDLLTDIFNNQTYTWQMQFVVIVAFLERFFLSLFFFFFLCVAERTFRERLLYAKHFSHLTSARRAKKAELPHFRLNKVRNIKCWLSVRSYLKRHGPQRSVDCIVSTSFILAVTILTFLCIQLLKEAEICTGKLYCYEMVFWNMSIGIYIMRLIILGSKINRKYRSNLSVLLTEQINLYLKLEQKPHKKEELTLANNVIKLACDLIKELEVPFKISGFSANPYLYNITKVIVLSAFSSLLSEILGFKLKLTKIKLSG